MLPVLLKFFLLKKILQRFFELRASICCRRYSIEFQNETSWTESLRRNHFRSTFWWFFVHNSCYCCKNSRKSQRVKSKCMHNWNVGNVSPFQSSIFNRQKPNRNEAPTTTIPKSKTNTHFCVSPDIRQKNAQIASKRRRRRRSQAASSWKLKWNILVCVCVAKAEKNPIENRRRRRRWHGCKRVCKQKPKKIQLVHTHAHTKQFNVHKNQFNE